MAKIEGDARTPARRLINNEMVDIIAGLFKLIGYFIKIDLSAAKAAVVIDEEDFHP